VAREGATIKIEELPICEEAKGIYSESGITELYPPQEEAIRAGVLDGRNLVLAVPTASGKTMIAELCALKHILERHGKVLYLVPLKALAAEKFHEFRKLCRLGIKIIQSTSDFDTMDPELGRYDIIIATNEKADSIFRHRPAWISDLSLVVADEIHLLGEPSRGPTLEAVLTGLRILNKRAQILALSATVSNADEVAGWLGAALVSSEWRPVPLNEGVYHDGSIMFRDGSVKKVDRSDRDHVVSLVLDSIRSGGQTLIFTGSRLSAVSLARKLQEPVRKLLRHAEERRLMEISSKILEAGEKTRLSERLAKSVSYGVAFHHAGLAYAHRKAVEDAFRSFAIKCICATPTLAVGVNLPARRVLIYDYRRYEAGQGQCLIPVLEEKQMAGRAGRPKYDRSGEAILLAKSEDERDFLFEQYVLAKPERIWSKLGTASTLRSHILSVIAMGLANSEEGVFDFLEHSFCAHQYGMNSFRSSVVASLQMLAEEGMICYDGKRLAATPLGRRVSELYIDPQSAVIILEGLRRDRSRSNIGYLTLICHTPDMPKLYIRKRDAELLEQFMDSKSDLLLYDLPKDGIDCEAVLSEIKTALLLSDWISEAPEDAIIERFDVGSGDIYAYVESAKWLIYSAHELAKLQGPKEPVGHLSRLYLRIENGVKEELLPLISLKGIGRVRARALYTADFKTLDDLRKASPKDLHRIPLIGPEVIKSIKEQVGGTMSAEEWTAIKRKRGTRQLSIEEYSTA